MRSRLLSLTFFLPLVLWAKEPLRLVTLSPAMTELVYFLGGESKLVGRSSACDYPAQAANLPVAGKFGVPSLAKLLELRANLLLTNAMQDPNSVQMLRKAGIEVLVLPLRSLADYRKAVLIVGTILEREDAAQKEAARIDRVIQDYLTRKEKGKARPKVLVLVWDAPPMAAGGSSYLSEYVRLCGGENAGDVSSKEFFRCSSDWLVRCDAEVILFPGKMNWKRQLKQEQFQNLPAVRNGRVFTDLDSDDLFRPGPRFERALKAVYERIHP